MVLTITHIYTFAWSVWDSIVSSFTEVQDLQIEPSEKGIHTNESMMLNMFYLYGFVIWTNRSSHQRCSTTIGVLRNFVKFTGKHLCPEYIFYYRPANLFKKRLWHRCFHVNFTKFLKTPFLQNTSGRLLLNKVHLMDCQNNYICSFMCFLSLQLNEFLQSEKKQN